MFWHYLYFNNTRVESIFEFLHLFCSFLNHLWLDFQFFNFLHVSEKLWIKKKFEWKTLHFFCIARNVVQCHGTLKTFCGGDWAKGRKNIYALEKRSRAEKRTKRRTNRRPDRLINIGRPQSAALIKKVCIKSWTL